MDLATRDPNEDQVVSSCWQDESSDCTTLSSISDNSPTSTNTTEINDDASTASESEVESTPDSEISDDEDNYSKKRSRRVPPPIFLGTPGQAEREGRAKYVTKMRSRRLLRKDSLELTRRKSVGIERREESWGESTSSEDKVAPCLEREGEGSEEQTRIGDVSYNYGEKVDGTEEDAALSMSYPETILGLVCEDGVDVNEGVDCWSESSKASDESSDEDSEIAGERTIRVQDTFFSSEGDSSKDQIPSTPTKSVSRKSLSRPSLAPSDADSSPGIALGLDQASTSQRSLFLGSSPGQDVARWQSPQGVEENQFSQFKFSADVLELEKGQRETPNASARKRVLRESPGKLNQAVSPSKTVQSSSPTKVVVRQTLSAWAHAKLKTPQSPEKKEWDRMHFEGASPSRRGPGGSSSSSSVGEGGAVKHLSSQASTVHPVSHTSKPLPVVPPQERQRISAPPVQIIKPPSRIARPVPVSRLPKLITQKLAAPLPSDFAKRIAVPTAGPSFRRVANTSVTAAPRPRSAVLPSTTAASGSTLKTARPQVPSGGPFRAPLPLKKPLERSLTIRPKVVASSSPAKTDKSRPLQRSQAPSSSPFKKPAVVKAAITPIVRDARLIAAPRRVPNHAPSPAPIAPSPSPFKLVSSSPACTPLQVSAGVGAARRVVVGRETAQQPVESVRVKATMKGDKMDRVDREKREMRIKEIMMGKSVVLEENSSSDTHLPVSSGVVEAAATKIEEMEKEKEKEIRKVEVDQEPRNQRRTQERQVTMTARKLSSSLFPSSSKGGYSDSKLLSISKTELSRLTAQNTQRNEMFVSQLERVVVRKTGEKRPASPSSKIRKSTGGTSRVMTKEEAREAREKRASRRTPEMAEGEEEERMMSHRRREKQSEEEHHLIGAGEDQIYQSPIQRQGKQIRRVRWHKSLFCGPSDVKPNSSHSASKTLPIRSSSKSCLRNSSAITLDHLGNVIETSQVWPTQLTKNKVIVYKIIYDDDEEVPEY